MQVPRGRVVSVGSRVRQGSQYPVYATLRLDDGRSVKAICKFPAVETRAPAEAPITECVATVAAGLAGVRVAPCFLAEAPAPVRGHLRDQHRLNTLSDLGFGTQVAEIDPIVHPITLGAVRPEDLVRLFCFDMVFLNADRTPENPNCGRHGPNLFAYDFGSALVSPDTPPRNFDYYYFGSPLNDRAAAHLCRDHISSPRVVEATLADMIDRVCGHPWHRFSIARLPQEHQSHLQLLVQFFKFLGENRDMVFRQVVSTI